MGLLLGGGNLEDVVIVVYIVSFCKFAESSQGESLGKQQKKRQNNEY